MGRKSSVEDQAESLSAEEHEGASFDADSPAADQGVVSSDSPADEKLDTANADTEADYADGLMDAISEAAGLEDESEDEDSNDEADDEKAETDEDEDAEQTDEKAEGEQDEKSEGDEKLPPFHKHPRWQEMVRERNTWREQAQTNEAYAGEYRKIEQFMQQNGLQADEVAEAIRLSALIKSDPLKARERLSQEMERLDSFAGYKLPQDLQADVEDGLISAEHARELAALRNQHRFAQGQVEQRDEKLRQEQQQRQQQEQQHQAQAVLQQQREAVQAWESDVRKRDPDYARIQPFVFKELRLLVHETPPKSRDEAVELAKNAYQSVKAELRRINGRRDERSPGPRSTQSSATSGVSAKPESFMDAVMQAAGPVTEG